MPQTLIKTAALALAALAALGVAPLAGAAVITNLGGTAPSQNVVDFNADSTGANTTARFRTGGSDRDLGQTFTASQTYRLDAVTVQSGNNFANAQGQEAFIELFTFDGTSSFASIGTFAGTLPSDIANQNFLRIDIDAANEPTLAAGQQYAFLFGFTTEGAGRELALINADGTNPFAGGRAIRREFGTGTGDTRPATPGNFASNGSDALRDFVFFTQATPVGVIPEPTSLALAGVAGLGLLGRRSRR